MILYPDFTENRETSTVLYFSAEGKDVRALEETLKNTYACYSAIGTVMKDGKTYVALEIEDDA